jgi:hypothetical protein
MYASPLHQSPSFVRWSPAGFSVGVFIAQSTQPTATREDVCLVSDATFLRRDLAPKLNPGVPAIFRQTKFQLLLKVGYVAVLLNQNFIDCAGIVFGRFRCDCAVLD